MINNEILALNPSETAIYSTVSAIISILSLLGSSFIISVYYYFKELQTFGFKLVIYLSMADVCFSFGKILSFFGYFSPLCEIQGYLITTAQLSSVLWTIIISNTLKNTLLYQVPDIKDKECKFLMLGFFFPLLYSFV